MKQRTGRNSQGGGKRRTTKVFGPRASIAWLERVQFQSLGPWTNTLALLLGAGMTTISQLGQYYSSPFLLLLFFWTFAPHDKSTHTRSMGAPIPNSALQQQQQLVLDVERRITLQIELYSNNRTIGRIILRNMP